MLTTIIVLLSIAAYAVVGIFVTKSYRDSFYRQYFEQEVKANRSRTRTDPDHHKFLRGHQEYSSMYANRRKWCREHDYKMPESWILADYSWNDGYLEASAKTKDTRWAALYGIFWPLSLSVMAIIFMWENTIGRAVEPATMANHRKQLNQADQLATKAKETLELANTFRKDDISTYNLLRETAEGMKEQAEQLRKLTV